ncbi:iduronate-2-sulfatase [Catenovulum maritimum]|uniref:Iduronate-2-sulfatase n=1 Tax=Catenovulum maritimum TaxID=1513271 RepID=A0A0J8GNX0_9ALTE|nr:iduronate-2-sulfatase [Catenovulum maritimum]
MFSLFCLSCSQLEQTQSVTDKNVKPNVLFISIDDLRPELGVYGSKIAKTPFIDQIAAGGITFKNAYAQQAICGPSRASVMTGLRPDTLEVTHNYVKFRHKYPDVETIPQHFMKHGYNASFVGKIFHHGDKDSENSWNWPAAFDQLPQDIKRPGRYALDENFQLQKENKKAMFAKYGEQAKYGLGSGPAIEGADVADTAYKDGYHTEVALKTLEQLVEQSDKPFFFGFGMNKPHLPWIAPKKYWDLYNKQDIALAEHSLAPTNAAAMGLHASFELRTFSNVPNFGDLPDDLSLDLKHAYLACISYVDAQIGKVFAKLKALDVLDNTIVIIWSDHGYHLGDKGIWGKASNYEIATRVPLIISTPETRRTGKALSTEALVELIDIYPTLAELANISKPKQAEGLSLTPLITNPDLAWQDSALSQFPTPALREWGAYPLRKGMRETYFGPLIEQVEDKIKQQQKQKWDRELFEQNLMGYSLRTKNHRLIAWLDTKNLSQKAIYIELYDHQVDPHETVNVAEQNPEIVKALVAKLYQRI